MTISVTGPASSGGVEKAAAIAAWLLLGGVVAIILGAVVLLWPGATVFALAWLIGAHLIVAAVTLVAPARHSMGRERSTRLVVGAMVALAGASTLMWPDATVRALALLFGGAVIVAGVGTIGAGLPMTGRQLTSEWQIAAGVLGVVAGLTAFAWPGVTVGVLSTMIGLYLVAYGVALSVAGWLARRQADWLRQCAQVRTAVTNLEILEERNIHQRVR